MCRRIGALQKSCTSRFCGCRRETLCGAELFWYQPKRRTEMFRLQQLDHVALTVRDVEKSVMWYSEVLGLQRMHEDVWGSFPAVVGVGGTSLALFLYEASIRLVLLVQT